MSFLYALESIRHPLLDGFFSVITYLGSEWLFIAAAVIVFWCVNKRDGYYLLAAGLLGTVLNQFLKITCRVARPWVRDPHFTIVESARAGATGYSFPSGHSQNVTVVMGCLARTVKKTWVRVVSVVCIVLVCFSRMYLGVHTPADVAVGMACALVLVWGLYPIFRRSGEKPWLVTAVFAFAAAVSLGAVLYVELYPWDAGVDAENLASAVKNSYTMLGCALGVLVGQPIERRYVNFDTRAPWWGQVIKCAAGIGIVLGGKAALKAPLLALLGGHAAATAVRYFLVVLVAIVVWPMTFSWFRGKRQGGAS